MHCAAQISQHGTHNSLDLEPQETDTSLVAKLLPRTQDPTFNAMSYHLAKVEWAVFGVLTFGDNYLASKARGAEALRQKEFRTLLHVVCTRHKLRFRNLVFYCKTEWGKGRGHLHFLIGRQGTEKVSPEALATSINGLWRHGRAQAKPFRPELHLEGCCYQSKYEYRANGEQQPFSEMISDKLQKLFLLN